jgi:hypothetical protein
MSGRSSIRRAITWPMRPMAPATPILMTPDPIMADL